MNFVCSDQLPPHPVPVQPPPTSSLCGPAARPRLGPEPPPAGQAPSLPRGRPAWTALVAPPGRCPSSRWSRLQGADPRGSRHRALRIWSPAQLRSGAPRANGRACQGRHSWAGGRWRRCDRVPLVLLLSRPPRPAAPRQPLPPCRRQAGQLLAAGRVVWGSLQLLQQPGQHQRRRQLQRRQQQRRRRRES